MGRVVVLGGGFGGVSTASHLRAIAPDHEVVLVDRVARFMMGFRKNDELSGRASMEAGRRPLAALEDRGIRVVRGTVTRVDPTGPSVETDGQVLEGDALVVALGAETNAAGIPGLREHGLNAYDPDVVPHAAELLASMTGGRLAVGVFGVPYTCPPAPYELALLVLEAASSRGADLDVTVFTPQPMSLPVLGPVGCQAVEGRLMARGIRFVPNAKAERVEAGRVPFAGSDALAFDLLLAVPPHRCPQVLVDAGLAKAGGWVSVDARTLQTPFAGVWAVGDCTAIPLANGQPLPKAGVLAEAEGRVVAERVAAHLAGLEPEATFDGRGACYLEVGGGEAMMVQGLFLEEPGPVVELVGPSPRLLEEKRRYERERLQAWFGSDGEGPGSTLT
jgi:sulfide:quinone oxidoreductase